jgi:hypothetical protein
MAPSRWFIMGEKASTLATLFGAISHRHADQEPGSGFYDMARSLGICFTEPYVDWSTQVQEVFELYGPPPQSSARAGACAESGTPTLIGSSSTARRETGRQ